MSHLPDGYSLRVAQPADFAAVRSFYDALIDDLLKRPHHPMWSRDGHPSDDYLRAAVEGGELWLAELDGEVAGAMVVNHAANDGYKGVPWQVQAVPEQVVIVHAFGVSPRYQGRGLGSAMMREIAKMKKDGLIEADRRNITLLMQ